jgi:site-specific DNA recombinase
MSSDHQDRSIGQQREWARAACAKEGLAVAAEFEDAAKSGTEATRRLAFQDMLRFCQQAWRERRPVEAIVVWNTDRFSRADSVETSWYVHEFRKAGVQRMLTATGWIDFSRAEHRVLFGIGQDLSNHHYSRDLAHKSVRGRIDNARQGLWNGGAPPFGYRLRDRRLVPDPENAEVLRWVFAEYASGAKSAHQLARALDERGVRPPGRAKFWYQTTVLNMLHNEVYLGTLVWNRRRVGKFFGTVDLTPVPNDRARRGGEAVPPKDHVRGAARHEALVSVELFEAVRRRLARRRKLTTPRSGHDYRLTGLLRCGHCGGPMVGRHNGRGRRRHKAFVCAAYSQHGHRACHSNTVLEAPLFKALSRKLKAELLNPQTLARLRKIVREQARGARAAEAAEREAARRRLAELSALISKAAARLIREDNHAVQQACREEVVRLSEERDRLAATLEGAPSEASKGEASEALLGAAEALMRRFDEALAGGEPADVRAVLTDLVDRVELFFEHRKSRTGSRVYCSFVRGLVYLRDDILPPSLSLSAPPHT